MESAIKNSIQENDMNSFISLLDKSNIDVINHALITASAVGNLDIIQYLVDNNLVDISEGNYDALREAIVNNNTDIVNYFYENAFENPNLVDDMVLLASEKGDLQFIEYLVEYDSDLHTQNDKAITLASKGGHLQLVNYLLVQGLAPEKLDEKFVQTYYFPTNTSNLERLYYLNDNGVDITKLKGLSDRYLYSVIMDNDMLKDLNDDVKQHKISKVSFILKFIGNKMDSHKHLIHDKALTVAVEYDDLQMAKLLVKHGADVNSNSNLLSSAIANENFEMVKFLVNSGVKLTGLNSGLLTSVRINDIPVFEYLVEKGANPDTIKSDILKLASKINNLPMVKYILENTENVKNGEVAVNYASANGNLEMVKYLLDHEYDIPTDALINAINNGHMDVVEYLYNQIYENEDYDIFNKVLIDASIAGNVKIIKFLDEHKVGISIEEDVLIKYASDGNHLELVEYLLTRGLSPQEVSEKFVIRFYKPTTTDNVARLYNLNKMGIDISQLSGLTQEDIDTLEDKMRTIHTELGIASTSPDMVNMIEQFV